MNPKTKVSSLAQVEIDDSDIDGFFELLGAQRIANLGLVMHELIWIQNVRALKASKGYQKRGLTWEQVCERLKMSVDTIDRKLKEYEKHGPLFIELNSILRISGEAYAKLGPIEKTEDGKLLIAGESFDLTKKTEVREAQAFIQQELKRRHEAEASLSDMKATAEALRAERDNAKKAAIKATRELADSKKEPELFVDVDEDHRVLLRVQIHIDNAIGLLTSLRERELSEENKTNYIGLLARIDRQFIQAANEGLYEWGRGDNSPNLNGLELLAAPDRGINLIDQYVKREKKANA